MSHWDLSDEAKKKLREHEAVEARAEAKTEAERVRMAILKQQEKIDAQRRQAESEQKVEAVKRKRKIKKIIEAASERIFNPSGSGELEGENKRSMQKLNSVGGKA